MKRIAGILIVLCIAQSAIAQKYMTRTGKVSFYSSTPLENIEAINNETASVLDSKSGDFIFQVPIKSFKFQKALMQEHFNENYMESDTYPKSEYKGKVSNISAVNFAKDGTYNVTSAGKLNIHGVIKDVSIPATITVKGKSITIASKFNVKPEDYKISIPKLVEGKIAKEIEVTVNNILEQK